MCISNISFSILLRLKFCSLFFTFQGCRFSFPVNYFIPPSMLHWIACLFELSLCLTLIHVNDASDVVGVYTLTRICLSGCSVWYVVAGTAELVGLVGP